MGRRLGMGCGLLVVNLAALPSASVYAQSRPPGTSACRFEPIGAGTVRTIIDGRSFSLDDGREIRLAGIEVPLLPGPGESGPQADAGLAARAALDSMLDGRTVELRHRGEIIDRYGRTLAYVSFAGDDSGQSIAHEMLSRGFARVAAQVGDRACATELLARERSARQAKLGLWGDRSYAVMRAENGAELIAARGHFAVVEGKVLSVRESGGTIYMNFGRRWSQALTVTVAKRDERTFAAAGLDPKRLENRRVWVRGFVEERSGPRIEAAQPEQIEVAD
jgi:endonuclease YncB( thermonuclease family)